MTPEQQSALEAVAGKSLTQTDIDALDPLLDPDNRNDTAIAAHLSTLREKRLGTVTREVFASWAAANGMRATIEDKATAAGDPLRSSALAMRDVLMGGAAGIRLDYPENQAMLSAWVALGALTTEQRDALLALGSFDDPVALGAVSDALNIAEGRATL